jgi:hypothetical protein
MPLPGMVTVNVMPVLLKVLMISITYVHMDVVLVLVELTLMNV